MFRPQRQTEVPERLGRPLSFGSKFGKGEFRLDDIEPIALCNVLGVSQVAIFQKVSASLKQTVSAL